MRRLLTILMLLPAALFGQAAFDLSLQQVNAGGTEFEEKLVSPAVSSLLGFSAGKVVGNVTIGSGLDLTAGVLSNLGTTTKLNSILAATGSNTIDSGNNTGQAWNWTNTTNSTNALALGETAAATNGTSTSGIPNQVLLRLGTLATSTMSPLSVYSRGAHVFSVSPTTAQILGAAVTAASAPTYSFADDANTGMTSEQADNLTLSTGGVARVQIDGTGRVFINALGSAGAPSFRGPELGGFYWTTGVALLGLSVNNYDHTIWNTSGEQHTYAQSNSTAYAMSFRKARGDPSTPTVITTGDDLLTITGYGYVGATNTYLPAAQILFDSTGTIADSTTGIGGQIKFYTTLAGTDTTPQLGATIEGGSTPKLASSGPIVHPAYTVATLPAAASYTYGIVAVSVASDAAGTNLGVAPTGGGAVKRMVYSDGTNWLLL